MPVGYETLDDAARRLGIHKSTLRRWLDAKAIRRYSLPGEPRTLVRSDAIDKLAKPQLRRADQPSTATPEGVSSPSSTG